MSKEIGPREKALREQREAAYEENQKAMREQAKADKPVKAAKPKKAKS